MLKINWEVFAILSISLFFWSETIDVWCFQSNVASEIDIFKSLLGLVFDGSGGDRAKALWKTVLPMLQIIIWNFALRVYERNLDFIQDCFSV